MPLEFLRVQQRFAAHLRDPSTNPAPADIEPRRMKIYSDLFYNNVEGFLATGFPVLRKLTPDARWHSMARDFFSRHRSRTPLFHRIAEEFLNYLEEERGVVAGDPAFLRELAHYEWVELALSVAEEKLTPEIAEPNGDLMAHIPVVSPLAWTLAYEFPGASHRPGFSARRAARPADVCHGLSHPGGRSEIHGSECSDGTVDGVDSASARLRR